jgi:hypothetical protein
MDPANLRQTGPHTAQGALLLEQLAHPSRMAPDRWRLAGELVRMLVELDD